jgi:hypothetical protein
MFAKRVIMFLLIGLVVGFAAAQEKGKGKGKGKGKDKDDVVGAIWHYTLKHDSRVVTGNFRVYQHDIYKGDRKIGVIKTKDNDEAEFVVSGDPELNGQAKYHKVKDNPQRIRGTLVKPNGEKWELEIDLKDK